MKIDQVRAKREEILRVAESHGAFNIRIFGSVARGEADSESDVDFVVDMERNRDLFEFANLRADLEELLDCRVDLVELDGLKESTRSRVTAEAVHL